MFINRLIGVIFGTSLILNGLIIVDSAKAQQNQSDISGTNQSDFSSGSTSDVSSQIEALFNDIRQFSNEIRNNNNIRRQPFSNSRSNTLQRCNLRRFALGSAPRGENESSRSCSAREQLSVNSDSTELNTLLENSKAFLERVNQDIEATKARVNNRLW